MTTTIPHPSTTSASHKQDLEPNRANTTQNQTEAREPFPQAHSPVVAKVGPFRPSKPLTKQKPSPPNNSPNPKDPGVVLLTGVLIGMFIGLVFALITTPPELLTRGLTGGALLGASFGIYFSALLAEIFEH